MLEAVVLGASVLFFIDCAISEIKDAIVKKRERKVARLRQEKYDMHLKMITGQLPPGQYDGFYIPTNEEGARMVDEAMAKMYPKT